MILTDKQKSGLLVAVISGGRPKLSQRPTAKLVESLADSGFHNVIWSVSERDVDGYESDGHEISPFTMDWAYDYARSHWMTIPEPQPGGFYGAFPGREWSCLEAERRGCWGVLQLDDNIESLSFQRSTRSGSTLISRNGGLGMFADLIGGVALSTNSWMTGASLSSVVPGNSQSRFILRTGFPYSLFIEKVGPGHEEWFGPYEDDITHAFQYGCGGSGLTASIVPSLMYHKEFTSKSGMRSHYNSERSKHLQRLIPQSANVSIQTGTSNGRGSNVRIFHKINRGAIRNPITVSDPTLYQQVIDELVRLNREWLDLEMSDNRAKVKERLNRLDD